MKLFIIAALLAASSTAANAEVCSPQGCNNGMVPGDGPAGKLIDTQCEWMYPLGWNNMDLNTQIYYVTFCKPRGWA